MPLSKQEELELWKQYKYQGDNEAKKRLLKSLRPLIQYRVNQFRNSGLPMSSLELEGMKLAAQALDTYDPSRGTQLNTHVTNYLKKVSRFATTYQNVGHIPEPRALMIGQYKAIYSNLEDEKGREPTVSELADAMNVPEAEIERLQKEDRSDLSIELRGDTGEDDAGGFFYDIIGEQQSSPTKQALDFTYFDSDPVDKKILEYTFGLKGTPQKNLTEIKQKLNLSDTELKKRKKKLASNIQELSGDFGDGL